MGKVEEVNETDELEAEEDEGVATIDEVEEMRALCIDETEEYGELAVFPFPERSMVLLKASFPVALPFQMTGQEATSTFKFEGTQLHIRRTDPCRIGRLLSVVWASSTMFVRKLAASALIVKALICKEI
jgi:hypothetical protein